MSASAFKTNPSLRFGGAFAGVLAAAAAAGSLMTSNDPDLALALQGPSINHWLGCDSFGADLVKMLLAGASHSLFVAIIVTFLNMSIGLVIGTAAALAPAGPAMVLTRLIDCFLAFPGLLLAILLASIMPRSEHTVIIALALTGWTARARFCRTLALEISSQPYIESATASGAGYFRVIRVHVWPAMAGQLVVQGALSMGYVILAEASLSFLGLGGAGENHSWGRLIAEGREYLVEAPHLSIFPGLAFVFAVVTFNLLAEGLRQRLRRDAS